MERGQRQPHSWEDVEDYKEDEDEDEDYDPDIDEEGYDEYYDDDDYNDDDDDDDDDEYAYADDHNCNFQSCSFLRIAGFGMESVGNFLVDEPCIANRREEGGGDSDEDDDNNNNDSLLCVICFQHQLSSREYKDDWKYLFIADN